MIKTKVKSKTTLVNVISVVFVSTTLFVGSFAASMFLFSASKSITSSSKNVTTSVSSLAAVDDLYYQGYVPNRTIEQDLLEQAEDAVWWSNSDGFNWGEFGQNDPVHGIAEYNYNITLHNGVTYPKTILMQPNSHEWGHVCGQYSINVPNKRYVFVKTEFGFEQNSPNDYLAEVHLNTFDQNENMLNNNLGTDFVTLVNKDYNGIIMVNLSDYAGENILVKLCFGKEQNNLSQIHIVKNLVLSSDDQIRHNSFYHPKIYNLNKNLGEAKMLLSTNLEWSIDGGLDSLRDDFGTQIGDELYKNLSTIFNLNGLDYTSEVSVFDIGADDDVLDNKYPGISNSTCLDSSGGEILWGGNKWRSTDHPVWREILKDLIKNSIRNGSSGILIDEMMGNVALTEAWHIYNQNRQTGCYEINVVNNFKTWLEEYFDDNGELLAFYDDNNNLVIGTIDDVTPINIDYENGNYEHLFTNNGTRLHDLFKEYNRDSIYEFWLDTLSETRQYASDLDVDNFIYTGNLPYDCISSSDDDSLRISSLLDYINYEFYGHSTLENSIDRYNGLYGNPIYTKHNPVTDDHVGAQDLTDWFRLRNAIAYSSTALGIDKFNMDGNTPPQTDYDKLRRSHKFYLINTFLYTNLRQNSSSTVNVNGANNIEVSSFVGIRDDKLIVNVINNNYDNTYKMIPQSNLSVTINIPKSFDSNGKRIYVLNSDDNTYISYPVRNIRNGKLNLKINELNIYKAIVIMKPLDFYVSRLINTATVLSNQEKLNDVDMTAIDQKIDNAIEWFNNKNSYKAFYSIRGVENEIKSMTY